MSALGQKQTLRRVCMMSALPLKADIADSVRHVGFVRKADVSNRSKAGSYSITLSVVAINLFGMINCSKSREENIHVS